MDEMLTRIFKCIGAKRGAQKKLAEYLGIHPNVITNWKNGSNKSYRGYVNEIAEYFGVSADYLLTGKQKESAPAEAETDNDEMAQILQEFRENPELRTLFSLSKKATPEELKQYISVIKALRGGN